MPWQAVVYGLAAGFVYFFWCYQLNGADVEGTPGADGQRDRGGSRRIREFECQVQIAPTEGVIERFQGPALFSGHFLKDPLT